MFQWVCVATLYEILGSDSGEDDVGLLGSNAMWTHDIITQNNSVNMQLH
jgi:hypothetical protein